MDKKVHYFLKGISPTVNVITRMEFELSYPIYQPLRSGRVWHKVNFLKRSLTGFNSEFSFS